MNSKTKKNTLYAITLILVLASFLRLLNLSNLPISLFGDEIDVSYQSLSLITTGRDYTGNLLPTYLQSLAEWRTPLLSYIVSPFVLLLKSSPLGVRLPVAILGILNIYLIYLLSEQLFSKNTALRASVPILSALILAITPWHIHFSRIGVDSTLLLSLLLGGTLFFLKAVSDKKYINYFMFVTLFGLSFYTYPTATLFVPLYVLSLVVIYLKNLNKKKLLISSIYTVIILLPFVFHFFSGSARERFSGISIFSNKEILYDIINQRTAPWVNKNSLSEKIFHNKVISYAGVISSNYLSSFSPKFLFLSGDPNFRHSIGRFGELLWVTLPFLLIGIFYVFKNISRKRNKLIISWLLLSPIPSALTIGGGTHSIRLIIMLPILVIISAIGIASSVSYLHKTKNLLLIYFVSILLFLTSINLASYLYRYYAHYKFESARQWQYGYKQIFTQLKPYLNSSGRVFINDTYEPSLLKFAYFTDYKPEKFQKNLSSSKQIEQNLSSNFDGFKFSEKYYFGKAKSINSLSALLSPGDLYLAVQGEEVPGDWDWSKTPPSELTVLGSVKDNLGKPLFYILTLSKK